MMSTRIDQFRTKRDDHVISTKGKSADDIRNELTELTGQRELDAVIDCAGAADVIQIGVGMRAAGGHYAFVGLVGDRIDIPLFPPVDRE